MSQNLPPLDIKCTSSDCDNDLHCFLATKRMAEQGHRGRCRACGADLIDWPRVHTRNIRDVEHTFASLKQELVRHYFWHKEIDKHALNHARRKGRLELRAATVNRIRRSVGDANPHRDGRQTPYNRNIIYYAQHATASCCRKCIEEWHGIPRGRQLTEEEINYLAQLAWLYIEERLPDLPDKGEHVPRLKLADST